MTASSSYCPRCNFVNPEGALLCGKCHALLITTGNTTQSLAVAPMAEAQAQNYALPSRRRVALNYNSVALFVEEQPSPIVVVILKDAVIGRYTLQSSQQPRVDLTPFGARDKGVSRLHMVIRRLPDSVLVVEDLSSTNGTWLNDVRLAAHEPVRIKPRDIVRLGSLWMEVYFEMS
jgi:hypothetical protein